ncbi:bifunctional helix-turn-helix transcriptional regulator/GNAT family N-acetyltransferase [Fusibacter bizertensis]
MGKNIAKINSIRRFNRFYTNVLGLVDQHILDSNYSLTEARILFELNEIGRCMANTLSARLNIDKSYLSRIIARFEKNGLISKEISSDDNRANFIELTEKGIDTIRNLAQKSNSQIEQLLASLSDDEWDEVHTAMDTIMKHFTKATTEISIRPFTPADIDFIISRQIKLYENEYGFTTEVWKSYVRNGVNQLVTQFDISRDCLYILEYGGQPSGCIAIAHTSAETAQLRFFFVEDKLRGLGAGHKLIDMAINFCREKLYKHVFLWTFSDLEAARHLYALKGFHIEDKHENNEWGSPIIEERWILEL